MVEKKPMVSVWKWRWGEAGREAKEDSQVSGLSTGVVRAPTLQVFLFFISLSGMVFTISTCQPCSLFANKSCVVI